MKYFHIPIGTRCEFEMYDNIHELFEIHRSYNSEHIVFNENELIEEQNYRGSEGTFMRFGRRPSIPMVEGDFYEYVVVDTGNLIIENR